MNVSDSSALRACTSCGFCGAVCPTGAIEIKLNREGFYRPEVDAAKCVDCGLCVKSCYRFDADLAPGATDGCELYGARAKNDDVVSTTTSGGIADVMARRLVAEGYTCIGVGFNPETNRAEGCVASDVESTAQFRGSKYIQSYSVDAFRELVKRHRNEKFAVFGLPCHIYAVNQFLKSRGERDRHVLIDLYCHGCPSLLTWNKYTGELLQRVEGKRVLGATFRSKVRGWGNFYVVVVVVVVEGREEPLTIVSPRINDSFYQLFFSDTVLNDSCPDCKLRSTFAYTDIRLGDFWGPVYSSNYTGMSAVTVCSETGRRLFASIAGEITSARHEFREFLPWQSFGKTYRVNEGLRERMLEQLANPNVPLKATTKLYVRTLPMKKRILRVAKNIVSLMPQGIMSNIKKIVQKLRK